MNDSIVTKYKGVQKIYFNKILYEIIKIANLKLTTKIILDYGCGEKQLEKLLNKKILNYDINPKYSEVEYVGGVANFDIVVINHVLMYFTINEIKDFFYKLWKINANIELVVGIGKQNFLSNFLKYATFNKNAHANTKISYSDQVSFLKKNTQILEIKKNIFFMTDIFYCKLNNSRISD